MLYSSNKEYVCDSVRTLKLGWGGWKIVFTPIFDPIVGQEKKSMTKKNYLDIKKGLNQPIGKRWTLNLIKTLVFGPKITLFQCFTWKIQDKIVYSNWSALLNLGDKKEMFISKRVSFPILKLPLWNQSSDWFGFLSCQLL